MVIKKTIQCPNCKNYKSYLIEETQTFEGITLRCHHCGKHHICVKQVRHITKWEEIKYENKISKVK